MRRSVFIDRHTLRLWVFEEFKEQIERCGTFVLDCDLRVSRAGTSAIAAG